MRAFIDWLVSNKQRVKRQLWDPVSSAIVLALVVFTMSFLFSFDADSIYKGGIKGTMAQWSQKPIINMAWVGAEQKCAAGFKEIPSFNQVFVEIQGTLPAYATQKRLCIQRGGLPSDVPAEPARPRSMCEKQGLQTCMTGKFPYCGSKGVVCPLVDVADFMQTGSGFTMRNSCNTSIPSALLPWMGCRPLVDVVLSAEHPCFEYNMHGWGSRNRPPAGTLSHNHKKCVRKDTRYRFMKAFPFVDAGGITYNGPNTGIFFRNELYYNPKCAQSQDKFEDGYIWIETLAWWMKCLLLVNGTVALYVAIASLCNFTTEQLLSQEAHPSFAGKRCDKSAVFLFIARSSALILTVVSAWYTFWLVKFFSPLTTDKTCVDPYAHEIILEVVTKMRSSTMCFVLSGLVVATQILIDIFVTPLCPFVEGHEGAPLLHKLPQETYEEVAKNNHIKFVDIPDDPNMIPEDMKLHKEWQ